MMVEMQQERRVRRSLFTDLLYTPHKHEEDSLLDFQMAKDMRRQAASIKHINSRE